MLTRNIGTNTDAIIIERDNIILDGTGYVLQGYGAAIILSGRKNVTVRNVETKPFEFGITFHYGIYLSSSSNNNICGNNIHAYIRPQGGSGIVLRSSSNNTVCRNSITNSKGGGIVLTYSSNQNIISENNMINNTYGVDVGHSFNNIVNRNYITSNTYGIVIREFSGNNSIEENTINNGQTGIELCFLSDYNSVSGNELVNNEIGMGIYSSDCNRIFENELLRNKEGIHFVSADRNRIYHNNFINNTEQVNISENVLDDGYPSGGNYWSDYNGTDDYCGPYQNVNGSDGIGDTPHFLNIIHMDNYPLMKPWPRRITVDVYPNILNLKNEIKQITVCIELLKGSDLARINVSSILLNGTFPVDLTIPISCGDYDGDTILDLACSFNRTAICDFILSNGIMTGDVILTITGQLYDGTPIVGNTTIKVRMSGDVNIDGKVDGKDLAFAAKAFDSNPARPNWDPAADENEDGKIDGKDIVFIAKNFGRTYL
jgi:parallel beta-helix repeat protein